MRLAGYGPTAFNVYSPPPWAATRRARASTPARRSATPGAARGTPSRGRRPGRSGGANDKQTCVVGVWNWNHHKQKIIQRLKRHQVPFLGQLVTELICKTTVCTYNYSINQNPAHEYSQTVTTTATPIPRHPAWLSATDWSRLESSPGR